MFRAQIMKKNIHKYSFLKSFWLEKEEKALAGKGSFFIMLVIIAFLSLALAVTAGLFFLTSGKSSNKENVDSTVAPAEPSPPKDSELLDLKIEKKAFNLKPLPNAEEMSYLQVSGVVKYFASVEGVSNTTEKMTASEAQVMEICSKYFMGLTINDVKEDGAIDKAKEELTRRINNVITMNEEKKNPIVYTINFSEWIYQ